MNSTYGKRDMHTRVCYKNKTWRGLLTISSDCSNEPVGSMQDGFFQQLKAPDRQLCTMYLAFCRVGDFPNLYSKLKSRQSFRSVAVNCYVFHTKFKRGCPRISIHGTRQRWIAASRSIHIYPPNYFPNKHWIFTDNVTDKKVKVSL
jgi:hypothetical protein